MEKSLVLTRPKTLRLEPEECEQLEQKVNKVIGNILHCLSHGSRLGWFVDPDDLSILVFLPEQQPVLCQGVQPLPVLPEIELALTTEQFFG